MDKVPLNTGNEVFWKKAITQHQLALNTNSIVPLETNIVNVYSVNNYSFELRKLISKKPFHLSNFGPKPNPFSPWDKALEISNIAGKHVLILNKFPVQIGHMLLITKEWAPQNGWLDLEDLKALEIVDADTSGLWFFNSSAMAGASQPHRHLQLLRRSEGQTCCPRYSWFDFVKTIDFSFQNIIDSSIFVVDLTKKRRNAEYFYDYYLRACEILEIGIPSRNFKPTCAYNLIISRDWMAVIRRLKDGLRGFSINGLGFAGYLLATAESDVTWLDSNGPESLLKGVISTI